MANFMNFEMGAMNVLTAPVDRAVVAEFGGLSREPDPDGDFAVERPKWNSDIRWVSAKTPETFRMFQSAFDRLEVGAHVRDHLDLEKSARMYAGFIVLRTSCAGTDFHFDWLQTGNQAFTFMTPISANAHGFGLLYHKVNGKIGEYDYAPGEGVMFGDRFSHSTKPGRSEEPVALLCFTFGTDKMLYWDRIMQTAGYQSVLIQRPDGRFAVRDGSSWVPRPDLRP